MGDREREGDLETGFDMGIGVGLSRMLRERRRPSILPPPLVLEDKLTEAGPSVGFRDLVGVVCWGVAVAERLTGLSVGELIPLCLLGRIVCRRKEFGLEFAVADAKKVQGPNSKLYVRQ